MKRGPVVLGGLVLLALVASFASRQPGSDSPVPSVSNQGPRGLAVLATWLQESSARTLIHDAPLTELPAEVAVVVLAAPAQAELRAEEVQALATFVEAGGTLVYLVPRDGPQPELNRWLEVSLGPVLPLVTEPGLEDVGGTSVKVTFAAGLLAGASQLRLSADRSILVADARAVAVSSQSAVWWLPRGKGEVWLAPGADLAENARLELGDNALFWAHLAQRGPILFDEFHHHRTAAALPLNLLVTALQLAFLAGLFLWARGARLGPPRDEPAAWHRSTLEYVQAMATLTQNARVEPELVSALQREFRRRLQEDQGVPIAWSWEQVDAELAGRHGLEAGAVLRAVEQQGFMPLSRALAELEHSLRSR